MIVKDHEQNYALEIRRTCFQCRLVPITSTQIYGVRRGLEERLSEITTFICFQQSRPQPRIVVRPLYCSRNKLAASQGVVTAYGLP